MEDDFQLWRRSRDGDAEAFACLFRRHARPIYNYCFRRVGAWAVAEDLVSIVFLEAWRREHELPPGKVLPWLYGIATNVVRNRRRSEWRYRAALDRLPRAAPSPDFADDVESRLDDEVEVRRILVELTRLPRRTGRRRPLHLGRLELRTGGNRPVSQIKPPPQCDLPPDRLEERA